MEIRYSTGGDVVGNFIRLCDDLGEDACASDLEGFLVEHGMLCADTTAAAVASGQNTKGWRSNKDNDDDDDSDDD